MSKFGIVATKKQDTVEYTMSNVTLSNGLSPILVVAPATDANKKYMSALLRQNAQTRRAPKVTLKTVNQNRDNDLELYADHVIRDWKNVVDEDNKPVKYSPKEGRDFLEQLCANNQNWVFDDLRMFCSDMSNFVLDMADEDDTVKNS